jgi:cytochrome c oxidase cbb3-type subunit 4
VDINDARIVITLVSFVLFLGIVAHAWSRRRRADYEEAANLPFSGEQHENESRGEVS